MADLPTHQLSCPTDTTDPDSGPGNDYGFCYHRFNSGSPHDETVSGVARGIVWAPGHLYAATKKLHVFWSFKPVAGRHPGRVLNFHTNPVFGGWEPDNSDGVSPLALDWFGDTTHEGAEGLMLVAEAENARGGSPYHFTVCDIAEMDAALSGGTWIDIEMEIDIGLTPGASAGVKIWVNCETSPRVDVDIRTHWPSQTGYALWEGIYNSSGFPVTTTGQFVASRIGRTRAEALDDGIGSTISEQAVYGAYLQSNPTIPAWSHTVLTPRTTDDFCGGGGGSASATFEFDHVAGEATAHVTGATIGHNYRFNVYDPDSAGVTHAAVTTSFDIVVTGIGGFSAGEQTFAARVASITTGDFFATTVFDKDADGEYEFDAVWDFDGVDTVSVTFMAALGITYELDIYNGSESESGTPYVGTGASHMLTTIAGAPFTLGFIGELYQQTGDYNDFSTRVFAPGVAGDGALGNPTGAGTEAVTFDYDGGNTPGEVVAHITGAVPGVQYRLSVSDNDSATDTQTAVGPFLTLTVDDVGGNPDGTVVSARVWRTANGSQIGITVIEMGVAGEYGFDSTWAYDGVNTVTVLFDSQIGLSYYAVTFDNSGASSGSSSTEAGTGAPLLLTVVAPGDFLDGFAGYVGVSGTDDQPTTRLFHQGVSGAGLLGNPQGPDPVLTFAPTGVSTTTATLEGSVNPEGVDSDVYFEYGLTTGYGTTTPTQAIGSGTDPVPVEQLVTGLKPGRTYHVRVVRDP